MKLEMSTEFEGLYEKFLIKFKTIDSNELSKTIASIYSTIETLREVEGLNLFLLDYLEGQYNEMQDNDIEENVKQLGRQMQKLTGQFSKQREKILEQVDSILEDCEEPL